MTLSSPQTHPVPTHTAPTPPAQIVALLRLVAQGGATPLGETILVSVYAWILAFMYAPPLHYSAVAAPAHPEAAAGAPERKPLEMAAQAALSLLLLPADVATLISSAVLAELRPIASAMLGATDPKAHLFSVSCASWLYDFATAVYFDLPGFPTPSSYGPIPVMPHGFESVAVLVDAASDTVVSGAVVAWPLSRESTQPMFPACRHGSVDRTTESSCAFVARVARQT